MDKKGIITFKKRLPQFKQATLWAALDILSFWTDLINKSKGDIWFEAKARQAYHDSMRCLVQRKVIEDFDVTLTRVKFEGEWYYKYPKQHK